MQELQISWYLFVLILGGQRHFPVEQKKPEVYRVLLRKIIPIHGLLLTVGSDNGPAFEAEITQKLTKELKIRWDLRTAQRLQSPGKGERMNRMLTQ